MTFGSVNVTIPNFYVTNYQQNNGTFNITSTVATGDVFSITTTYNNGNLIHQVLTANAGNGPTQRPGVDLADSTVAGGGFTGLEINVTGSGVGSGAKYLLDLNPGQQRSSFDMTGSFRPTTNDK